MMVQATNYIKATLALIAALTMATVTSFGQIREISVDEFLAQLGPNASQTWFDPATGYGIRIDGYGKLNTLFGVGLPTTVSGKVTARDLGDGTERVTVALHARDALCWGVDFNTAPATPMFGYAPAAVVNGVGPAALGDVTYRIVFAPQPIGQFDLGGDLENWFGTMRCRGVLRAGSGYPEGTPGFAQSVQVGLLNTGVPGGCPPEKDGNCFPSEIVQFKPAGN